MMTSDKKSPLPARSKMMSAFAALASVALVSFAPNQAAAQNQQYTQAQYAQPQYAAPQTAQVQPDDYQFNEMVSAGHNFFGNTSNAVAQTIEGLFSQYGMPNGYILGQEGSGAFVGGLTYGEGVLHTKNAGDHNVFWQGPSVGWDYGGAGSRTMMLVYSLPSVQDLHGRYGGVAGSAYLVAGAGVNVLKRNSVVLVPVRTGVGARLGVNVGYLKLTPMPTWNPF